MTIKRDRRRGSKKYKPGKVRNPLPICSECGQPGSHFVGPSFGQDGFFFCKVEPKEAKQ